MELAGGRVAARATGTQSKYWEFELRRRQSADFYLFMTLIKCSRIPTPSSILAVCNNVQNYDLT